MLALEIRDHAVDTHVATCNLDFYNFFFNLIILATVVVCKLQVNPNVQHLKRCCVSTRDVHYSYAFPLQAPNVRRIRP